MIKTEKEYLAENPIRYKVGDIIDWKSEFGCLNVYLDNADASGNIPPLGYLWARKYTLLEDKQFYMDEDGKPQQHIFKNHIVQEILGMVNIFNGQYTDIDSLIGHTDFTLGQVVALYHHYFPKKTLWQKIKEFFHGSR